MVWMMKIYLCYKFLRLYLVADVSVAQLDRAQVSLWAHIWKHLCGSAQIRGKLRFCYANPEPSLNSVQEGVETRRAGSNAL